MRNVFFISDTHFGHRNILNFVKTSNGLPLRPFSTIEEMNEKIVGNWNSVVHKNDRIYHLGDICLSRSNLPILERLHGRKVLIKGNHDNSKIEEYLKYFDDIRGSHIFNNYIMTHIPVHPCQKVRFSGNIHGHLHDNIIDDPWYINVSVENINYTPISSDILFKK